jgi:hypothetical protein
MSNTQTDTRGKNRRTALILVSVALAFAAGAIVRQWLFGH